MAARTDSAILHEIVRIIQERATVPEKVRIRTKQYQITYLEDHRQRLEEAIRRHDTDRLGMLFGQLPGRIKYQMMKASRKPAGKPVAKVMPKPAGKVVTKPAKSAAKPAAKSVAKPAAKPAGKPSGKPAARPAPRTTTKVRPKPVAKPKPKANTVTRAGGKSRARA